MIHIALEKVTIKDKGILSGTTNESILRGSEDSKVNELKSTGINTKTVRDTIRRAEKKKEQENNRVKKREF